MWAYLEDQLGELSAQFFAVLPEEILDEALHSVVIEPGQLQRGPGLADLGLQSRGQG